ncbi:MAG: hypothetical protein K6E30_07250 [Lachnospiraceae bacterium]|nr:hypothetical protein [Lachnospiraceae bacterium]
MIFPLAADFESEKLGQQRSVSSGMRFAKFLPSKSEAMMARIVIFPKRARLWRTEVRI